MYCKIVCAFSCLIVCILVLHVYSPVHLIFCNRFVHYLLHNRFAKFLTFTLFDCFAGFVGVVAPILAEICCHNSVLFAFCALHVHNPGQRNSFCGVSTFFDVCFAYFVRLLFF